MNKLEEMLLELKDASEFMVDLAYSSMLYNNMEIAEEVIYLSENLDEHSARIQDVMVEIVLNKPEEVSRIVVLTKLQVAIMSIAEAAKQIADVVIRGLANHPVLAMSIRDSETTIASARVSEDSILNGKTFGEVRLSTQCGMFVIAIKRDREYIFGPGKDTMMEEKDLLIAKGPEEGVSCFKALADGSDKELDESWRPGKGAHDPRERGRERHHRR